MFVLVYSNQDDNIKRYKALRCYLPKGIIKNYTIIINRKNFYDHPIYSNVKRYTEIRKLTRSQSEGYITGCLLDYDYIKNHYRIIAANFIRQKELDADRKVLQQK